MRCVRIVSVLVALTFALVAFASVAFANVVRNTAGTSVREGAAARQYLADTAPVDRVSAQFQAIATLWIGNSSLTNARAESAAQPLVIALATLRQRLQFQKWPASVQRDVNALMVSFARLATDLRALAHDKLAQTSSWESPLLHDDIVTTAATDKVRHDLNLPALAAP